MNYKVLAVSVVIGVGVIAAGLMETQGRRSEATTERLTTVDIEEPESQFGFMEARSSGWLPSPVEPELQPAPRPASAASVDVAEAPITVASAEIPVGLPQIAYVFSYGYRIAGPQIPALQQRHADLCEGKGPLVCRIIAMDQTTSAGEYTAGKLELAVASSEARAFGKQLATIADGADGKQVTAAISGEDLSKRIVDTEARLRARLVLRDRLMEVLATRRGTVTELVEAERGVAQVNEEIDQARSWLSEMNGRVVFSRLDISYESSAAPVNGFMDPVRGAIGSLGSIFGVILAVLIVLAAVLGPLLAGAFGIRHFVRRISPGASQAAA
jgi:hypothetical protein